MQVFRHKFTKKNKYGAEPTERDGFRFDSKHEASVYDRLKLLQQNDDVLFFLRQVPFHLPGNVTYRCDFQVFFSNGTVEFWDAKSKGTVTESYKMKKKMVESLYPIEIIEIY